MLTALILRGWARHPLRTALVTLGVAVAAALLLDMVMLAGGMERSFSRMLTGRGFQIRLAPKGPLPFDSEATIPGLTPLLDAIRADPAVELAGPVVSTPLHLSVAGESIALVGYGIDPTAQGIYQLESGADLAPGDSTGLLLSEPAAQAAGLSIGDTVTLRGRPDPQAALAAVERTFTVRGIVRFLYDSRGQRSVGADYRVVQALGRFPGHDVGSTIMVKAISDDSVEALSSRLAASHPTVEIISVAALVARFRTRLAYFQQLSLILATISLVVGVLLVGTILTITVSERSGELAVLRAIGMRRHRLMRMVVAEGAMLTLGGVVAGTGLGLLTARYLDAILTSFPGLPAAISFFVAEPGEVLRAGILVMVAGVVAAGYPAWLAARAPIAATMRADA